MKPENEKMTKRALALTEVFDGLRSMYLKKRSKDQLDSEFVVEKSKLFTISKGRQSRLLSYMLPIYMRGTGQIVIRENGVERTFGGVDTDRAVLMNRLSQALFDAKVQNVDVNPEISNGHMLDAKSPLFVEWDKKPRAFYVLNNFYKLDVNSEEEPDIVELQAHLAFFTSMLIHVARLNDNSKVTYNIIPVLMSRYKNIGKSSFIKRLLTAIPNGTVAETSLSALLDDQARGRLYNANHAVILDELSGYAVAKKTAQIKAIATETQFQYDQKYKDPITKNRQTAIYATTNDTPDMFSQHEIDRRIQLIRLLPLSVEERTDFEDFDFAQVWSEVNYYVQRMTDKQLVELTNWSTDLTRQNIASDDIDFKTWLVEQTNILFRVDKLPETVLKTEDGFHVEVQYFIDRLFMNMRKSPEKVQTLLGMLGVDYNANAGDYPCNISLFKKRLSSFVSKNLQMQLNDFHPSQKRNNGHRTRGYLVTQAHANSDDTNDLKTDVITQRFERLKTIFNEVKDSKTNLSNDIEKSLVQNDKGFKFVYPHLVEFMTPKPLASDELNGLIAVQTTIERQITYYHYIGVLSSDNIEKMSGQTMSASSLNENIPDAILTIDGELILIGETNYFEKKYMNKVLEKLDTLVKNAFIPIIAEPYSRRLARNYKQSELDYHVDYDEIFIDLKGSN